MTRLPTSYELEFSADDALLCSIGRNVLVHSLESRKRLWTKHPLSNPSHICFSPDNRRLAVKATCGQILILDAMTGALLVNFGNKSEGEGSNLEFSECGSYLVDGSWQGSVTIRSASAADASTKIQFPGEMITAVCRAKYSNAWAISHQPKHDPAVAYITPYVSLHRWPICGTPARIIRPMDSTTIQGAVLSPDGLQLAIAHSGQAQTLLSLHSVHDGSIAGSISLGPFAGRGLRWSNDGRFIGFIDGDGISIHSGLTLARTHRFDLKHPSSVAFSSDSSLIALGSWEGGLVQSFAT